MRSYQVKVNALRNGAVFTELKTVDNPAIDSMSDAEIASSMSAMFLDDPDVNWLTDEIQPVQIIDGIEYPVGVFPIATAGYSWDETGRKTVSVEAYDRSLYLKQAKTESIFHLDKGTNYILAVEQLLVEAGISLYLATPTEETLPTDREDWEVGTPYLTIINDLLDEIGYSRVWFNSAGLAVLAPKEEPSVSILAHQYGGENSNLKLLQRSCSMETDVFDKPNVFVVICSNPDLPDPLISTVVNENPLSALSVFKRGRRIPQIVRVNNIPSQAALDAYAQKLCTQSMLAVETATISTANLPVCGAYDTVALTHPDMEGLFQEVGWSLILAPGQTMIHRLRRSMLI